MRWTGIMRRARAGSPQSSSNIGQWIEAVLLVLLMIQVARLLWALGTPVGLFGEWQAREPVVVSGDARRALFAGFDPFFRAGASGEAGQQVQQVTALPLTLYGTRLNEASGQGSAIIANGEGEQISYAVGEEIAPGVTLKAVMFDHVVIERGGASETLYIDQSSGADEGGNSADAPPPGPGPGPQAGAAPPPAGPLTPEKLISAVSLMPRTENGRITGIVVGAQGQPEIFAQAGFRQGDIIVQVNGQPVRGAGDIETLQNALRPGSRLSLMVERGSATVPVAIILPDSR